jgi:hypothetical protein
MKNELVMHAGDANRRLEQVYRSEKPRFLARLRAAAPSYIFFAAVEIPCTLFIIWLALRWRPDAEPAAAAAAT